LYLVAVEVVVEEVVPEVPVAIPHIQVKLLLEE
jgi:hypothetical protein